MPAPLGWPPDGYMNSAIRTATVSTTRAGAIVTADVWVTLTIPPTASAMWLNLRAGTWTFAVTDHDGLQVCDLQAPPIWPHA